MACPLVSGNLKDDLIFIILPLRKDSFLFQVAELLLCNVSLVRSNLSRTDISERVRPQTIACKYHMILTDNILGVNNKHQSGIFIFQNTF